jgi:uncharacterized protein YkwD
MAAMVNSVRANAGLPGLAVSSAMTQVARTWSAQLDTNWAHNPSVGSQIPGGWTAWGENIAYNSGGMAAAQSSLEASQGHYDNMVNASFTHIGVGIVQQNGITYVTQVFARY